MAHISTQSQFDNSLFTTIGGTEPVRVLTGTELSAFIAANNTAGVSNIGTPELDGAMLLTIPFTKDGVSEEVSVDLSSLAIDVKVSSVTYNPATNTIDITNSDSSTFSVEITDLIDTVSNTLSSSTNTMSSSVNGVNSSASIINSIALTKNGSGQLIVTVNGISSSPLSITAANIAYTPSGNIEATNVAAAIAELDTEKAGLDSPTFTGTPSVPTAADGTDTTQIASTEFVNNAVANSISELDLLVSNPYTVYLSDTRNLNGVVGTPTLGDISKVFNPYSTAFNWNDLNGLSLFFLGGDYSGITDEIFINADIIGNRSSFNKLQYWGKAKGIVSINELDIVGISNLECEVINTSFKILNYGGNITRISVDDLLVDIDFYGTYTVGDFVFDLKRISANVALKQLSGNVLAGSSITLNIDTLDDLLEIKDFDLSGITLNINIKNSNNNGKVYFHGITVTDATKITLTGNFIEDGLGTKNIGEPIVKVATVTNSGTLSNRINIVGSSFKVDGVYAIDNASVGFNLINCSFITLDNQVINPITALYALNCITNEPVASFDYSSSANVYGYIVQDINFS